MASDLVEDRDPELLGLPDLPRPGVAFAEHSYPAYSRKQMIAYARTALAEQSRLNEEMKAEAYRRGVEDAAKVADRFWNADVVPEARGENDVGAAIRALPADKERA